MAEKNKSTSKKNAEIDLQPVTSEKQPEVVKEKAEAEAVKVDDPYNIKGKVSVYRLNVREKASSVSNILGVISEGDIVWIDNGFPNKDFYKVYAVVDGVSVYGYCAKQFIEFIKLVK